MIGGLMVIGAVATEDHSVSCTERKCLRIKWKITFCVGKNL